GDDGDAAVTEPQEVTCGGETTAPVLRADARHALGQLARGVDDHEGDVARGELAALGVVDVGEHEDHTEGPASEDVVEPLLTGSVLAPELGEDHPDPLGP